MTFWGLGEQLSLHHQDTSRIPSYVCLFILPLQAHPFGEPNSYGASHRIVQRNGRKGITTFTEERIAVERKARSIGQDLVSSGTSNEDISHDASFKPRYPEPKVWMDLDIILRAGTWLKRQQHPAVHKWLRIQLRHKRRPSPSSNSPSYRWLVSTTQFCVEILSSTSAFRMTTTSIGALSASSNTSI